MSAAKADAWADAIRGAALLGIDPRGLNGAVLRSAHGPARNAWLGALKALLAEDAPMRRIPAHIEDDRLLGGLDLAATLSLGKPVVSQGVLAAADGGVAILQMAERCSSGNAARLASALDLNIVRLERDGFAASALARFMLIALDEGADAEECVAATLSERLALHIDLSAVRPKAAPKFTRARIAQAVDRLRTMAAADEAIIESICTAAGAFGVFSPRAALFTLRAARASAALEGRDAVGEDDLALAARLVLAPRARFAPQEAAPEQQNAPPPDQDAPEGERDEVSTQQPDPDAEHIVDAVRAALPEDFLAQFLASRTERRAEARARGAGAAAKSARRGRPLGARSGVLRAGDRLDVVATLRAAAPWQKLRRAEATADEARVLVRKSDFRVKRFVQRLESTTIFVVDASGSTALQRLAEAKGAVERLLADAYVSRARVALIAFRKTSAEVLLPPTRSLARAKRCLGDLSGGGATPLAAAISAAAMLGQAERAKGRTPLIVFLTDGRGNIASDGEANGARAESDALDEARKLRAMGLGAVFIDTSARARPGSDRFAAAMGAAYAPLPFVEANRVAEVVRAHAPARR